MKFGFVASNGTVKYEKKNRHYHSWYSCGFSYLRCYLCDKMCMFLTNNWVVANMTCHSRSGAGGWLDGIPVPRKLGK